MDGLVLDRISSVGYLYVNRITVRTSVQTTEYGSSFLTWGDFPVSRSSTPVSSRHPPFQVKVGVVDPFRDGLVGLDPVSRERDMTFIVETWLIVCKL